MGRLCSHAQEDLQNDYVYLARFLKDEGHTAEQECLIQEKRMQTPSVSNRIRGKN